MREKITDPLSAPNMGSYSPAVRIGDWLMISGQGPLDAEGKVVSGDITAQVSQTLSNIKRLVEAAGASMDQVARCTCHLADLNDFDAFDAAYRSFFTEPYPARTTVGSALPGILVEIDAMVWLGGSKP